MRVTLWQFHTTHPAVKNQHNIHSGELLRGGKNLIFSCTVFLIIVQNETTTFVAKKAALSPNKFTESFFLEKYEKMLLDTIFYVSLFADVF